ncbi:MAG: MFS transporter [Candidatus Kerfeldbacteria bacterium]|nr:MFS transporter [Candidatus Kerfeldbacteria bacterium]
MYRVFAHFSPHYFQKRFSHQLEELYISVAILDFALAAVTLFEPVYLFQLGYSISHILLYYIVVYGLYYFLVPLGGKFVARFGPERSIAVSSIMLVGYYLSLMLVATVPAFFWVAPVFFALQKMWYWPAYHTDFIMTSDQGERGKEFSGLWSLSTLMFILGPVFGGFLIKYFGFSALFLVVIGLIIVSNAPLFIQPVPYKRRAFSYWQAIKQPFTKLHIRSTIAYLALGEELVLLVIWPIFIALAFKDFLNLGGAIAVATLITGLVTLYIGKVIDRHQTKRALRWGAIVTAFIWITRPLLKGIPAVFTSETIGRIAKNTTFVPLTAMTYERALGENQIIERSVFYEQGFALAKTLIAAVIIILAQFLSPFTASFVAAAAVSLLYLLF